MSADLLEVEDLHAYYGKSHILQGVSIRVGTAEIVSLLGRNGVGRSTMVKALMGVVKPQGSIRFKGEEIAGLEPHRIAHKGLGCVPETRDIFALLTVRENLLLGFKRRNGGGRWTLNDAYGLFPVLKDREDTPAGVLSGGEQQMLTMCRTLMGDPDLVLIDEPTEGLSPKMTEKVGEVLEEIVRRGVSVLLIEQKLALAMKASRRLYVMGHGRIMFEGSPAELKANEAVRKVWLEV
jgi:branched-chain amino acid transport system ATP-binding protein